MPSVDFYYVPESPPCRTVEMVAEMAKVTLNKHLINLFNKEQFKEDFVKLNPLHKVPFLVDGEVKINESRAIVCYLINKYLPPDNSLYPADPIKRAKIDELLYLDMGTIDGVARKVFVPIIRGYRKDKDASAEKELHESLTYLDQRLASAGSKFLLGDELTVADLSIAASLSFMESFEQDFGPFKSLAAYNERLKASIPKYAQINEQACKNLNEFYKKMSAA